MSDENNGGSDTGSFIAFCICLIAVTLFYLPAIVVEMPFHGFSFSESWEAAMHSDYSLIGSLLFWMFMLWLWAGAKDKAR